MTNFEKWKESILIGDMIIKWVNDCEKCPLINNDKYCPDYISREHCLKKLKSWAESEAE